MCTYYAVLAVYSPALPPVTKAMVLFAEAMLEPAR